MSGPESPERGKQKANLGWRCSFKCISMFKETQLFKDTGNALITVHSVQRTARSTSVKKRQKEHARLPKSPAKWPSQKGHLTINS